MMTTVNPTECTTQFDLAIIGSGPGGYVGAVRAAQLGMSVVCIERDALGGVCLNYGCIPTKALIRAAELYTEITQQSKAFGIEIDPDAIKVNWDQVIGRSRTVTANLNKGVAHLFKKNKITHIQGHAKITCVPDPKNQQPARIQITAVSGDAPVVQTITANRILIATGGTARQLPFAPFDGQTILSAKEAMLLSKCPAKMVIVGAGAIGCEFAYFYNAFGTDVTIVEMLDHLLPIEDADIAKVVQREFKKSKIKVKVKHTVKAIEKKNDGCGATVTIAKMNDKTKTETLDADVVLVAVGVCGQFDNLFDESIDIATERDHIKVDYLGVDQPTYETSIPHIYAIGDCIGPPWLAHVASEEAVACVERIAGHCSHGINYNHIPGCTYCNPQVASVGATELTLIDKHGWTKGVEYEVGAIQLKGHGKAVATGHNVGLIKILASVEDGRILGAHVAGDQATELIGEFSLAMTTGATVQDLARTTHAHPSMHEAIHEAALAICNGASIHG